MNKSKINSTNYFARKIRKKLRSCKAPKLKSKASELAKLRTMVTKVSKLRLQPSLKSIQKSTRTEYRNASARWKGAYSLNLIRTMLVLEPKLEKTSVR